MLLGPMSLVEIYRCMCDLTRLRILSLLGGGELCVCHIQEILGEPQVKVSKHLAYLRARGLVVSHKEANWMVYGLPAKRSRELSSNLACLQDCVRENPVFSRDLRKLQTRKALIARKGPICCAPRSPGSRARMTLS
jgi:ArsR family transcriptional regulator